jgi:hypothetical protein
MPEGADDSRQHRTPDRIARPTPVPPSVAPVLVASVAVGKTPGKPAGSRVRVGSENGDLVRRTQAVRREGVAHGGSEVPLRKRAACFLERVFPTATSKSSTGAPALNPWEQGLITASELGSCISLGATCTTRRRTVAIPSRRSVPPRWNRTLLHQRGAGRSPSAAPPGARPASARRPGGVRRHGRSVWSAPAKRKLASASRRRADCQVASCVHDEQALRFVRRTRLIESRLTLKVNRESSAVDRGARRDRAWIRRSAVLIAGLDADRVAGGELLHGPMPPMLT